jgi:tRNA (guanine-N7-)-methyltransferase
MSEAELPAGHPRRVRSFVRREGRMTDGQKSAMERLWPRYGLEKPQGLLDPHQVFGRTAPLVLEIGFGNGDHLLSRATHEPQHDFIGAEVHRPGVGHLMLGAEKAGLNNIRAVSDDAVEVLRDWLPEAALSEAIIYFPDPWHKKRHHKRRLIQPEFTTLLASRIRPGGRLLLATDWAHYAAHMLAVLNTAPEWRNEAADGGYVPRHATRPKTKFEARGERLGHEVFDLSYIRR